MFSPSADEWNAFGERLKLLPCPHCKASGTLIFHGFLYGFDDSQPRKTPRARRLFCSNRNAHRGCGRTLSIWLADKIRRLSVTAGRLWRFLQHAANDTIAAASGAAGHLCDRTWQRIWTRFHRAQSNLRTALSGRCPPPELPATRCPAAHVLAHLQAAFPNDPCPIAAFQQTTQRFFL